MDCVKAGGVRHFFFPQPREFESSTEIIVNEDGLTLLQQFEHEHHSNESIICTHNES